MRNASSLTNAASEARDERPVYDLTPFSMLDYPGHLAAIIWFAGCDMRCDFCYNRDIVLGKGRMGTEDVLDFLKRRVDLLDGVVLSGGEATLYAGLPELCGQIKRLGYAVKLDTNGLHGDVVAGLAADGLIDAVALDYKAPRHKFADVTHHRRFDAFEKTLDFLIKGSVPFEVRTTVHTDLLDEDDIGAIIDDLWKRGYRNTYYLQEFRTDTPTIGDMPPPKRRLDMTRFADSKLCITSRS